MIQQCQGEKMSHKLITVHDEFSYSFLKLEPEQFTNWEMPSKLLILAPCISWSPWFPSSVTTQGVITLIADFYFAFDCNDAEFKSAASHLVSSCKNSQQLCSSDITSNHTQMRRCIQAGWQYTSSWPCPNRNTDPGKGCTPCMCHHSDCSQPAAIAVPPSLYQHTGVPKEEKMQYSVWLNITVIEISLCCY